MGDWDFLHEMSERGFSAQDVADAAACGMAPWDRDYLDKDWLDSAFDEESEDGDVSLDPVESFQSRDGFPHSLLEQFAVFEDLVDCARRHFENTGRYLQIWGELGEVYAELKFGLRRHPPHMPGSDGTIAGKLVEVKTISPEKFGDQVLVKSQGDFEQLLIVRIDRDFQFRGKLFERSELKGSSGRFFRARLTRDSENS